MYFGYALRQFIADNDDDLKCSSLSTEVIENGDFRFNNVEMVAVKKKENCDFFEKATFKVVLESESSLDTNVLPAQPLSRIKKSNIDDIYVVCLDTGGRCEFIYNLIIHYS